MMFWLLKDPTGIMLLFIISCAVIIVGEFILVVSAKIFDRIFGTHIIEWF